MKNKAVALGAAFLLLGSLLFAPVRRAAATTYTKFVSVWIVSSLIDSTPIGATTPSSGSFTTLNSTGGALNGTVGASTPAAATFTLAAAQAMYAGGGWPSGITHQGAWLAWNGAGGGAGGYGGTEFVNNYGAGTGGFQWWNTGNTTLGTMLMSLDQSGNLVATGNVTASGGTVTATTFAGNVTGNVSGNAGGNAATATALASSPSNCSAGSAPTGINTTGAAQNCTSYVSSGNTRTVVNSIPCTPGTSTDANCTGTLSIGSAFGDANYMAQLTPTSTAGANLGISIVSKTSSAINYNLFCNFNCGSYGTIYVDVWAVHP